MPGLARHEPHVETATLPVGGTALLFTDGLVEDRLVEDRLVEDRSVLLDDNLEKLRAIAANAAPDVEAFVNQIVSIFGPSEDDVAMIAVRRTG